MIRSTLQSVQLLFYLTRTSHLKTLHPKQENHMSIKLRNTLKSVAGVFALRDQQVLPSPAKTVLIPLAMLSAGVLVVAPASAATVDVSNPNNIAGTATLSSPDGDTTFVINPLSLATDDLVSDGIPGDPQSDYTDTPHLVYNYTAFGLQLLRRQSHERAPAHL